MSKKRNRSRYGRDAPAQARDGNAGAVFALADPPGWEILLSDGYRPVIHCPEVQICIGVYASLIASMTLRLMRNTEKGDVREKNQLSRLLDIEPNRLMTHMDFFQVLVRALMETGNQVTVPTYHDGFLSQLIPLRPAEVSLLADGPDDYRIGYRGRTFRPDEVLHFRLNPDPDEPWRGQGYQASLRDVVRSIRQANATRKALQESPSPSIIVKVDGLTQEFQDKEGRAKLTAMYLDSEQKGQPWLIPAEGFSVEQVKPLNLSDLAIKDSLELDKRAVAAIFGIPPFLVGIGDFKLDEYQHFVTTRLMAVARVIEQTLTRGILYSPDLYLSFNPRSLYNYSLTDLVSVGSQLIDRMAMRRNELRDWLGLPPDAEMDELLALENYIPVSRLADQKKLKDAGDEEGEEHEQTENPDDQDV